MRAAVFSLLFASTALGQAPAPSVSMSIDEAIRLAEQHSESVEIARAGVSRADAEVLRARSEWFPQINGSLGYDRQIISLLNIDDRPPEQQQQFVLIFAPNTWTAGVSLNQNLFAGFRTVGRQDLAAASRRVARLSADSARAQAVLETVQAYYEAVLSEKLLKIAESTLRQAEATYQQTKLGRERGTRPEFDLLRASVALENQRPVVLQRRQELITSQLRLKQILEIPADKPVALTSTLDENLPDLAPLSREVANAPDPKVQPDRVPVRQAAEAVHMREAAKRMALSQHYPQVNLASSFNYSARTPANNPFPDSQFPFRPTWGVGLSVQIPIFSGFRVTGDVDTATADLLEAQARLRQTEELIGLDSRNAQQVLATAQATWEASSGVVEQARKAYDIARIRFNEGISTQLELSDAQLLFEQAQANRARAARDLQVARVRLSLLPLLPATSGNFGFAAGSLVGADASSAAANFGNTTSIAGTAGQQGAAAAAATGAR